MIKIERINTGYIIRNTSLGERIILTIAEMTELSEKLRPFLPQFETENHDKDVLFNKIMIQASALTGDLERAANYAKAMVESLEKKAKLLQNSPSSKIFLNNNTKDHDIEEFILANHEAVKASLSSATLLYPEGKFPPERQSIE